MKFPKIPINNYDNVQDTHHKSTETIGIPEDTVLLIRMIMCKILAINPQRPLSFFDRQYKSILNIIHQNIQCLSNKILSLDNVLVDKYNCDFLLLTEHWQNRDQLNAMKLTNFALQDCFCRKTQKHGGVALYKNKQFSSEIIVHPINEYCVEGVMECCCIEVIHNKTIIVVIYRPPSGNFDMFLNLCNGLLNHLYDTNKSLVIGGDFNIDFLRHSTNLTLFKDLLICFNLSITVNLPTRVTSISSTCLDNFLITTHINYFKVRVVDLYLSDHFSQSLCINMEQSSKKKRNKICIQEKL